MECRYADTLRRLASLARIGLSEDEFKSICLDFEKTAEFLRSVSEIARELNVEPLYYVWDLWGPLRDPGEPRTIDVRELPVVVEGGYIKVTWRGGRLEEA